MVNLQVYFDRNKYAEIIRKCSFLASGKEINKAISKGAKKAADEAKKETLNQFLRQYTLSGAEIKPAIKTRRMGGGETGAVMQITSGVIPLYQFDGVTPREIMPPAKGPVRAAVKISGGEDLSRAFVAKMPGGHIGVFEREGVKRLDKVTRKNKVNKIHDHISEFFGPSIAGMFGREKETEINTAAIERAKETLDKHILNELERLLNG
jgi:hypothetical protein